VNEEALPHWGLSRPKQTNKQTSDKFCRENQTKLLYSTSFYQKIVPFLYTVEKCGTARHVTDDKNGACALHAG